MARLKFSIGRFDFLDLEGAPQGVSNKIDIQTRPGVSDVAIWNLNQHGEPFTLRSKRDTNSITAAQVLMRQYRTVIGQTLRLVWADVWFADVSVINVTQVRADALAGSSGGLSSSGLGYLEADWLLVARE